MRLVSILSSSILQITKIPNILKFPLNLSDLQIQKTLHLSFIPQF